jgi:hypothetical protein
MRPIRFSFIRVRVRRIVKRLQVVGQEAQAVGVIVGESQNEVARFAQEAARAARSVAVVDGHWLDAPAACVASVARLTARLDLRALLAVKALYAVSALVFSGLLAIVDVPLGAALVDALFAGAAVAPAPVGGSRERRLQWLTLSAFATKTHAVDVNVLG